jgi:DNA-directed RNA polymerase
MSETGQRSSARFIKRNQLVTRKNRRVPFIVTQRGRGLLTVERFKPLAEFLDGKHPTLQPDLPAKFLREPVQQLNDPMFLAMTALAPLLDGIFRGWDREDPSWEAELKEKIGDHLYQRLRRDPKVKLSDRWGAGERVKAGAWLLDQALYLDIFDCDEDNFFCISDSWKPEIDQLWGHMIAADPSYAPHLKPPPPWTGFWKTYDDDFRAPFVRDRHPEIKKAINDAFLDPDFEHARGVNALSQVPLKIDPKMVALVERFAVELMGHQGKWKRVWKTVEGSQGKWKKVKGPWIDLGNADQVTVAADVSAAKWCVEQGTFWNDYNCDFRGRVYSLQHLNFARADHVRSLFRFANGLRLGGDTRWLEIHCANCAGYDKKSREDRIEWIARRRQDIEDIERDPEGTFDKKVLGGKGWQEAKEPFQFVAACRELVGAWKDPANFVTTLPIGFDGSCNGLQHLALLIRDKATADMVNLSVDPDHPAPKDAYAKVIAKTLELIKADDCDHAGWWREQFGALDEKQKRSLLKQPIMTFAYSVTPYGATDQIQKVYKDFDQPKPPKRVFGYLARKVLEACALVLLGPKTVMDYVCAVAEHCTDDDRFLKWTSPSGFPVSNRYQVLNIITVICLRGSDRAATHEIADGFKDEIDRAEAKSGASPNFVHSLDAAHLIKVVNTAASEGITDLLTVHDCFYCLAPQATRLHKIIRDEMQNMYRDYDPLGDLRDHNVSDPDDPDLLPVPRILLKCVNGEWEWLEPFNLPDVQDADYAFD